MTPVRKAVIPAAGLGNGAQNRTVKRGDGPDFHSNMVLEFEAHPELSMPW